MLDMITCLLNIFLLIIVFLLMMMIIVGVIIGIIECIDYISDRIRDIKK